MMKFMVMFCSMVIILAVVLTIFPINGEEEIYDNTVRLHVVANSDSQADQELKLEVRDEILEDMTEYLDDCNTKYEAELMLKKAKEQIEEAASETVNGNGFDYEVSVEIGDEYYPTREYEGVTLPAGTYCSVRVNIGEAEGQNWWCVLFPPLCVDAAEPRDKLVEAGFTPSQIRVLTETENPKYVLKFKILEIFEALKELTSSQTFLP